MNDTLLFELAKGFKMPTVRCDRKGNPVETARVFVNRANILYPMGIVYRKDWMCDDDELLPVVKKESVPREWFEQKVKKTVVKWVNNIVEVTYHI